MITKAVRENVAGLHITHRPFDDELSQRGFDHFFKELDPMKQYFLQADIDEFQPFRKKLDDNLLKNDIQFAYDVYKRLLERMEKIIPVIHKLIDMPHDFTIDESIVVDRKSVEYAKNFQESEERWRKQIKYFLLALKADEKTDEQAREQLHRRYRTIEKYRKDMDVYELLELFLSSMTESLDPHTNYMAPRAQDNFKIQLGLKLDGIGAQLKSEDGTTVISSTVPGGAADRDGRLKPGDQIIGVGQEGSDEMVDVVDMKLDDVVSMIRGPAGTKVRLKVQPKVGTETLTYDITRAKIELTDSAARGEILERGMRPDGKPYQVGYIELPSFYLDMEASRQGAANVRSTTADVQAILERFQQAHVDVVVLDLSRNGGGSLQEAISCTGLFITSGPVVQVKNYNGEVNSYDDDNSSVAWDGPLVIMTSKLSASASEIFAGAIKDYNRGIVVGDPTSHGKGTVQTLVDVGELIFKNAAKPYGALKLTIQQFYLPDGRSTQLEGVAADVVLPSMTANIEGLSESDLDFALPMDKVTKQPHDNYGLIDSAVRAELAKQSSERVSNSEDFAKLNRRIAFYLKQKNEKTASVKESEFMAKRAEFDSEKEEEDLMKKQEASKEKIFDDSFYNEEVLNISIDYTKALSLRKLAKAR
ncbi:MAG: carboxy terminal-processing peptidase [Pirellulaceae bacterium]|nr:carboxy terminal-processing peptidase [Pirellulaceae bacterium]